MKEIKQIIKLSLGLSLCTLFTACATTTEPTQSANNTKTVTVLGVVVGEQQDKLEAALAPFEKKTGIKVIYEGTDAFATLLPVRVESGDAPDVAMFPQPGLMRDLAQNGLLVPITKFMKLSELEKAYSKDWLDLGKVDNQLYGVWYRASVKSLVWYNPEAFAVKGYQVPQTWSEMLKLSDRIVADGSTPWCLGMESGDATGWVGTDWIEDIMLRTAGVAVYDRWINHEIPFDVPPVKEAFNKFGEIVLNPDYVQGGIVGAISIPFGDSVQGLVQEPPSCYLHRQANFISSFFGSEIVLGENMAVFALPGIKKEFGNPVLVAGDVFAMFNDTPEARALMAYLATPEPHEIWAKLGGFISPHQQVSLDVYPDPVTKKQAKILADAEVIRFDASDMMPSSVGTGTFWTGIIDFVGGDDLDRVLKEIEEGWNF
jgi:alpha-glucoside transport system substrate-binding protein